MDEVFEEPKVNEFGIDVETSGKGLLISKLAKLKSTLTVEDGGVYWMDKSYSQVWIKTEMSESELDDWLYNVSFPRWIEIVGIFELEKDGVIL